MHLSRSCIIVITTFCVCMCVFEYLIVRYSSSNNIPEKAADWIYVDDLFSLWYKFYELNERAFLFSIHMKTNITLFFISFAIPFQFYHSNGEGFLLCIVFFYLEILGGAFPHSTRKSKGLELFGKFLDAEPSVMFNQNCRVVTYFHHCISNGKALTSLNQCTIPFDFTLFYKVLLSKNL